MSCKDVNQTETSCRVFIKGLPEKTFVVDLLSFFDGFGLIRNIRIRGTTAIVYFDNLEEARKAIYHLNGRIFNGHRVLVRWYYYRKKIWYKNYQISVNSDNANVRNVKSVGCSF